jgi:hypothetical protein
MAEENREEFGAALDGPDAVARVVGSAAVLAREDVETRSRIRSEPRDRRRSRDAERPARRLPRPHDASGTLRRDLGLVDDELSFTRDWGFALEAIAFRSTRRTPMTSAGPSIDRRRVIAVRCDTNPPVDGRGSTERVVSTDRRRGR